MDDLSNWANKYPDAAKELQELILTPVNKDIFHGAGESDVSNVARLDASYAGGRLFRNNVGAGTLLNGSFLRWGLANDSERMNKQIKSADLIGIKPIRITADMVDTTIGQFWSFEVKRLDWKYKGTDHEQAQMRWAELVNSLGGCATIGTKLK